MASLSIPGLIEGRGASVEHSKPSTPGSPIRVIWAKTLGRRFPRGGHIFSYNTCVQRCSRYCREQTVPWTNVGWATDPGIKSKYALPKMDRRSTRPQSPGRSFHLVSPHLSLLQLASWLGLFVSCHGCRRGSSKSGWSRVLRLLID